MLRDLPEVEGEAPYLEIKVLLEEPEPMLRQEIEDALVGKKYRLARIISAYRQEGRVEKEVDDWKRGLQEMSPLQIAQSAFEKVYQTEMSAELTDYSGTVMFGWYIRNFRGYRSWQVDSAGCSVSCII